MREAFFTVPAKGARTVVGGHFHIAEEGGQARIAVTDPRFRSSRQSPSQPVWGKAGGAPGEAVLLGARVPTNEEAGLGAAALAFRREGLPCGPTSAGGPGAETASEQADKVP